MIRYKIPLLSSFLFYNRCRFQALILAKQQDANNDSITNVVAANAAGPFGFHDNSFYHGILLESKHHQADSTYECNIFESRTRSVSS